MKDLWGQFEDRVQNEVGLAEGCFVTKIPSGMKKVGTKVFRMKTDFDFAASIKGFAVFFDAKACGKKGFYLHDQVFNPKKIHQFTALSAASLSGAKAGYLIWFYETRKIVWFPVEVIKDARSKGLKAVDEKVVCVNHQDDELPINLGKLVWGM